MGAPRAIAQASVMPGIAVNEDPKFVEWNKPVSVDTHTSPLTVGLTITLKGAVEEPRVDFVVNVCPPFVDR